MTALPQPLPQGFLQEPPQAGNLFTSDVALQAALRRLLPPDLWRANATRWAAFGADADARLRPLGDLAESNPPRLRAYDPWGRRIDKVEVHDAWNSLLGVAAQWGLIADAYDRGAWGAYGRVVQAASVQIFGPWSAVATCPLAMTDGCARVMETFGRSLPFAQETFQRLTSRDPARAWTAGQWMTEKEGGSDVSNTSTVARFSDGEWRLYGTKFFTSATTSQCTLTLARPEGEGAGSGALQMFYLEPWLADGSPNALTVRRLKEKLGTKALPTAELELLGTRAHLVGDPQERGIKKISTVLNICRYWNTMSAAYMMRQATALALDYAQRRAAFGRLLIHHPLHAETLAALQVEYEGALAMTLRVASLLGSAEAGEVTEAQAATLRLLTPLAKLMTGKQAVAVASEALEAFGGAGYMEDTGLPRILRDAQVLPIWEGTTNVLSLDALRAMSRGDALPCLLEDLRGLLALPAQVGALSRCVEVVGEAARQLGGYARALAGDLVAQPLHARAFAMSLARTYVAALLTHDAAVDLRAAADGGDVGGARSALVAERWCRTPLFSPLPLDSARAGQSLSILGLSP
jgi:alkylation response protein AidB-like acyl-CoA dehydrogenase